MFEALVRIHEVQVVPDASMLVLLGVHVLSEELEVVIEVLEVTWHFRSLEIGNMLVGGEEEPRYPPDTCHQCRPATLCLEAPMRPRCLRVLEMLAPPRFSRFRRRGLRPRRGPFHLAWRPMDLEGPGKL